MAHPARIGVLTFHRSINYGSYWQARCLVQGLRRRGYDAELLDHDSPQIRSAELRCAFQPELPERTPRQYFRSYGLKARRMADAVAGLPRSRPFPIHEPDQADDYDAIVVGSDEVWNFRHPWFGSKPIFFGEGLKTERLASYAASFGHHDVSSGIHPDWGRRLDRFRSVSVRDDNSRRLIRDATGREPAMVLDPCLQFPDAAESGPSNGDYAVVYGHGFPPWLQRGLRRWSERRGIALVSIGYRNPWVHEERISAGPHEFAEAMSGAAAIVTNFFHGCVFALLNGKPWASCPSAYRSIKIPDLAELLGAGHRLIDEQTPQSRLDELLDLPVEPEVSARIAELRQQSEAFLDAALP